MSWCDLLVSTGISTATTPSALYCCIRTLGNSTRPRECGTNILQGLIVQLFQGLDLLGRELLVGPLQSFGRVFLKRAEESWVVEDLVDQLLKRHGLSFQFGRAE